MTENRLRFTAADDLFVSFQSEIVSRLMEILSEDTEGFSRRAVVRYFIAWFSSSAARSPSAPLTPQRVRAVLLRGGADLDWEVKVYTLELAELLLDEALSAHRAVRPLPHAGASTEEAEADLAAALNGAVELGVVSVLLGGLVDCDRPVALKACQLLLTLRETLRPLPAGPLDTVACELPHGGWGEEIRKILRVGERDVAGQVPSVDGAGDPGDGGHPGGTVSVREVLASLGLDEKLDVLSRSSDHVHNSALSLLQDILTAGAAHTRSDTQPGQDVIVDCY